LRLELTRILSSGQLAAYWPKHVLAPQVEEKRLSSGDFSFEILNSTTSVRKMLPILVERKRIGDIVQRSSRKDHWYQMQRMHNKVKSIDDNGVCIFLLEGDIGKAIQFSQETDGETCSQFNHSIDDYESMYRFMGRAILRGK
jgi:hypothetical protein